MVDKDKRSEGLRVGEVEDAVSEAIRSVQIRVLDKRLERIRFTYLGRKGHDTMLLPTSTFSFVRLFNFRDLIVGNSFRLNFICVGGMRRARRRGYGSYVLVVFLR